MSTSEPHLPSSPSTLTVEDALQQATTHHRAGRLQEAEKLYRVVLQVQPRQPDANHNLGVIAIAVGRQELALPFLKTALEANPKQGQYWLSYIEALLAVGELQNAHTLLEQAMRHGLSGSEVDRLADRLVHLRETSSAVTAELASPPSKVLRLTIAKFFKRATNYQAAGRILEAEQIYQKILSMDAAHAESFHQLGSIAYQRGQIELSAQLIRKAIAAKADVADYHSNLGNVLRAQGKLHDALICYEKALTIKSNFPEVIYNLGLILESNGKVDEAIDHYERAIALKPTFPEALNILGSALQRRGSTAEAILRYNEALTLKPKYPEAHYNLGIALEMSGKRSEAIAHYKKAVAIKPRYPQAHYNLGIALEADGRPHEAIACYQQAIAIKNDYADAFNNLGVALFDQGRLDEAIECCFQALASTGMETKTFEQEFAAVESLLARLRDDYHFTGPQETYLQNLVAFFLYEKSIVDWPDTLDHLYGLKFSQTARFYFLVLQMISHWVRGEVEKATSLLVEADRCASNISDWGEESTYGNMLRYRNFIDALMRHPPHKSDRSSEDVPITMIGNSHCLSFNGCTVEIEGRRRDVKAELVIGGKAWHFATSAYNRYKRRFEWASDRLPGSSTVFISFGEIDCRLDEGILPAYQKHGGDLSDMIRKQADDYVRYVSERLSLRKQVPIFMGVPAPNLNSAYYPIGTSTSEDQQLLIKIIRLFNEALNCAATDRGCKFIDLYSVTVGPNGKSNGTLHIDSFHLRPEALGRAINP